MPHLMVFYFFDLKRGEGEQLRKRKNIGKKKRKKSYNLDQLCKRHQHIKENWGKGEELM